MKTLGNGFRLLEDAETIRDGDRVALRVPGGWSCSFGVSPRFRGLPKSEAQFDVARPGNYFHAIAKKRGFGTDSHVLVAGESSNR